MSLYFDCSFGDVIDFFFFLGMSAGSFTFVPLPNSWKLLGSSFFRCVICDEVSVSSAMRLLAVPLFLLAGVCVEGLERSAAKCTFERNSLCDFTQAQDDDFDWQLVQTPSRSHVASELPPGSYMMVKGSASGAGQQARLLLPPFSQNDTHCLHFTYLLYDLDGGSPGDLKVYVRVNNAALGNAVFNVSGSQGRRWHKAELSVSTFWPSHYQVVFEATVWSRLKGYIGLDDIELLNYPCYKVPNFSRLGDVEVNAGQNATFQCIATGHSVMTDAFVMEGRNGAVMSPHSLTSTVGKRGMIAAYQVGRLQYEEQDFYRCVVQSTSGAAVSNFAQLFVRAPPTPVAPPQLVLSGSTYLILQLNTHSMTGDGPVIWREIVYGASHMSWTEKHGVSSQTYKIWHLEPDTEYHVSVLLTRPGDGGTGPPGPPMFSRTKCAEPMRPAIGLSAVEIEPRQLHLEWEPVDYNLTRCHTYFLSLCYRYVTATMGRANAAVNACVSLERNSSRFLLQDLPPFHTVHVKLLLANPEGRKESREVTFQTEEDIPGSIAPESLIYSTLVDGISLRWEEPLEPNGQITHYEISYQSSEAADPSVHVPGPRHVLSKLKNNTSHVFSGLDSATTYLLSLRAGNNKGLGPAILTDITTRFLAPIFDHEEISSPLSESESTITVLLPPAVGNGAPISTYHVVVVEDDGSRQMKRRQLEDMACFRTGLFNGDSSGSSSSRYHYYYCAAELPQNSLTYTIPFTVGDNHTYGSYWNEPLDPEKNYLLYLQASSNFKEETRISCIQVAQKEASKRLYNSAVEVSQAEDMGQILGAGAGGLIAVVLLLGAITVKLKKVRTGADGEQLVGTSRVEKMCRLGTLDNSMIEHSTGKDSRNLLSVSRRNGRQRGSPYHTGQLHPAVRVTDLLQHISHMKTGDGHSFKQEYQSIFLSLDSAEKKSKRKITFLDYNLHRVRIDSLRTDSNLDSANANYIDGYQHPKRFIATQVPKQEMVNDFWRMVWQENCYSLVLISRQSEVERNTFWPEESELYGDIKIILLKTETLAEWTVRTFTMKRQGYQAKHEICQFHFTAWPEHGVPPHATGLLAFLRRVKTSTPPDAGPVVIHCSVGAGGSGCYVALDVMLDMAECEAVVDIYNCVKTLCSRRLNMIQTEEQYKFIHEAMLEACLCGETAIPVSDFAFTFTDMLSVDPQTNTFQLHEEFQTLVSITPHLDAEQCSVSLLPKNREKNRSLDLLPPDRLLPLLVTTESDTNSYINATLMDSFHQSSYFVVTPHPLPTTSADFWRLVFDYGCTSTVMLNQLNQSNSARPCLQYWPEAGVQQYGAMTVELLSKSIHGGVISRLFRVSNVTQPSEGHLVVRHFQFLRWSADCQTPDCHRAFLSLLLQVRRWQKDCGDGRVLVHCLNGAGPSGIFCACIMIMEMVHHQNTVDIFYAVKTLRSSKPNMVESLEQYRFCYELALEYVQNNLSSPHTHLTPSTNQMQSV